MYVKLNICSQSPFLMTFQTVRPDRYWKKQRKISLNYLLKLLHCLISLCQFIGTADPHLCQKPEVGHGLESCTKGILPFKVKNTTSDSEGRSVILVDTPGFDDSNLLIRDQDRLEIIMQWLKNK